MKAKNLTLVFIIILCLNCTIKLVNGDGIIIPDPLPGIVEKPELSIKYHHVNVSITDQYAETEIDQVFQNPYATDLEGTYIFPIPEKASVHSFSMFVDGEEIKAELLEKEKASQLYEEIVRKLRDPALLEYIDRDTLRARVYPIPANGEKRVKLKYSEILKCDFNVCRYWYPLKIEGLSAKPLEEILIKIRIKSKRAIKAIYSPTHSISVKRINDHEAEVYYEANNVKPSKDFELYYTLSAKEFGVSLLAHKTGKEGFFMLLIAPKVEIPKAKIAPKDIVFVIDTSGSMSGKKIAQAKNALKFCIENLNEKDRFSLIAFSTEVEKLSQELLPANKENLDKALSFIDAIEASGGTNINDALIAAIKILSGSDRQKAIIFLTDGKPTVGVTSTEKILKNVREANNAKIRLFVFGVGYEVNTHLLDRLAQENRGTSEYVTPEEDIELKISNFYSKVKNPILTDLSLEIKGIEAREIYPKELPDIFQGSQLILLGKYSKGGDAIVTLKGKIQGEEKSYSYEISFPSHNEEYSFIPRLWATRKIGYLLDQIRLNGESKELIDEIINLSLKYGIITPYTSFLVDVDTEYGRPIHMEEVRNALTSRMEAAGFFAPSGAGAVKSAITSKQLQKAETQQSFERVRVVGTKVFYYKDGIWVDNDYSKNFELIKIRYDSEAYWNLLRANPQLGKYFALGKRVRFCLADKCYEIGEEGLAEGEIEIPTTTTLTEETTTIFKEEKQDVLFKTMFIIGVILLICAGILIWNRIR